MKQKQVGGIWLLALSLSKKTNFSGLDKNAFKAGRKSFLFFFPCHYGVSEFRGMRCSREENHFAPHFLRKAKPRIYNLEQSLFRETERESSTLEITGLRAGVDLWPVGHSRGHSSTVGLWGAESRTPLDHSAGLAPCTEQMAASEPLKLQPLTP